MPKYAKTRGSTRNVKPHYKFSGKTLYIHGHGELRAGDRDFQVPHGVHIFLAYGPGVAATEALGEQLLRGQGTPVNLMLLWIDRPGQPAFTPNGEAERQHKLYYPMYCPNYTLLPPNGLADYSGQEDVYQTLVPITLQQIVTQRKHDISTFVWSNCTVLRDSRGKPLGGTMDDLGDPESDDD